MIRRRGSIPVGLKNAQKAELLRKIGMWVLRIIDFDSIYDRMKCS